MDRIFQEEERRIDLASIKKIDGNISHILDKTDNVAFYRFDGKAWHKDDIHGSIFVFSRSVAPYYGFTILNRKSLSDNVIELLVDGLEFQRCDLYLLYKTSMSTAGDTGIKSIWFEDDAGCIRISALLNRLMRMRDESPGSEGSGNILQMFERSKERVRQSISPDTNNNTCHSPSSSPPYRHNNKRNNNNNNTRGCHDLQQHDPRRNNNFRNGHSEHDYRTNNFKHDPYNNKHHGGDQPGPEHQFRKSRGNYSQSGGGNHPQSGGGNHLQSGGGNGVHKPHVKHQNYTSDNNGRRGVENGPIGGINEKERNLFNMFSKAHKRFNTKSANGAEVPGRKSPVPPVVVAPPPQPVKSVTIMKRCNSEMHIKEPDITTQLNGLCVKSRSSENVKDITLTNEAQKDVKTIPITFQDLVNSVKPRIEERAAEERPLSCYSIGGSSSGADENPGSSRGDGSSSISSPHSPSSSVSDPLQVPPPDPSVSSQLSQHPLPTQPLPTQSAPLPTQLTLPTQPPSQPSLPSPSSNKVLSSSEPLKTQLSSINMADSAKLLMSPLDFKKTAPNTVTPSKTMSVKRTLFEKRVKDPKPSTGSRLDMDLSQFKELLVAAIEEDDDFAATLYTTFQKRLTTSR